MNQLSKFLLVILFVFLIVSSCSKKPDPVPVPKGEDPPIIIPPTDVFNINNIHDTYGDVMAFSFVNKWGPYNVHDPSIKKFGDYYYCYSTDAAYGNTSTNWGLQIRKSKDLVEWFFVGWVFNSQLPPVGIQSIISSGGVPNSALWAPYIMKVESEYRLYYSNASNVSRLSVIGLATSSTPEGPWIDKGSVVVSRNDNVTQTNAIDPTVATTPSGEQYMYYGSGFDGIYVLKLNASSGLAASEGDIGRRIVNRGYAFSKYYNGNIEGPEVIYNQSLNKYFLFIAYDWLETKYNTRVCRGDSPLGPFYDFKGEDANSDIDHGPMIVAPYKFLGHGGWQGLSHCSVFNDGNGQYFIANQGRPSVNKYFMDMQVRKLFWTDDGWPVASPERYAWEKNNLVPQISIIGIWERIVLNYRVVPGYQVEQFSPDLQVSEILTIDGAGTLNGDAGNKWSYTAPWLQLKWSNGTVEKLFVQKGRDWENKIDSCLIFTGLNNLGTAIWGKSRNKL